MKGLLQKNWEDLYLNAGCGLLTITPKGEILKINNTLKRWLIPACDAEAPANFLDLLTGGSKLYYNLFVLPILELHGEAEEISLSLKMPSGELSILFNGQMKVDDAGNKTVHAALFRLNNRNKFEKEILLQKNKAQNETMIRNEALHKIAYDHAHQFRAPLSNIMGLINLLQGEAAGDSNMEIIGMLKESAMDLDAATRRIIQQSTVYK